MWTCMHVTGWHKFKIKGSIVPMNASVGICQNGRHSVHLPTRTKKNVLCLLKICQLEEVDYITKGPLHRNPDL